MVSLFFFAGLTSAVSLVENRRPPWKMLDFNVSPAYPAILVIRLTGSSA